MADLLHLDRSEGRRRAAELLGRFDLAAAADKMAATYSGGMRRKLDLAMTLVGRPQIIFLDEPTTGLDPRSRRGMWGIIRDLVAGGVTIFLTTQYLEEADQLADRIAVLDHGRLVAEGTPSEPVTFTSYNDATIGGDTNNNQITTPRPGDWGGIVFRNYDDAIPSQQVDFPVDGILVGPNGAPAISGAQDAMSILNFVNVRYAGGAVPQSSSDFYSAVTLYN